MDIGSPEILERKVRRNTIKTRVDTALNMHRNFTLINLRVASILKSDHMRTNIVSAGARGM